MNRSSIFVIAEIIHPANMPQPFVILETVLTSDGMRTRTCDGRFTTRAAAHTDIKRRLGLKPENEPELPLPAKV